MSQLHAMVNARVPYELARDFAAAAERDERSMSSALRLAMRDYLVNTSEARLEAGLREVTAGQGRDGASTG
jgi:hypothetical protein